MATKKLQLAGVRLVNEEDYGKSAYEIALDNGFKGTEAEWVESLKGEPGEPGAAGYVPVKGVDYYTTADRNELRSDMVKDLVPEIENYLGDTKEIFDVTYAFEHLSSDEYFISDGSSITLTGCSIYGLFADGVSHRELFGKTIKIKTYAYGNMCYRVDNGVSDTYPIANPNVTENDIIDDPKKGICEFEVTIPEYVNDESLFKLVIPFCENNGYTELKVYELKGPVWQEIKKLQSIEGFDAAEIALTAVRYEKQSLTEEQKAQARENIGITEVVQDYYSTTREEIGVSYENINTAYIWDLYNALMEEYPDKVKKLVWIDETKSWSTEWENYNPDNGTFVNYVYVVSTGDYNEVVGDFKSKDDNVKKPKYLVLSGIHGYEKTAIISVYRLFRDVVMGYNIPSQFREGCVIHFLPVATPYGVDNNTRYNANGVDINRNFDWEWDEDASKNGEANKGKYPGDSAASEKETQAVSNWLQANQDAELLLDCHNMSPGEKEIVTIVGLEDSEKYNTWKKIAMRGIDRVVQFWKNVIGYKNDTIFRNSASIDDGGLAVFYASEVLKIPSLSLELSVYPTGNETSKEEMAPETIAVASEAIGNALVEFYNQEFSGGEAYMTETNEKIDALAESTSAKLDALLQSSSFSFRVESGVYTVPEDLSVTTPVQIPCSEDYKVLTFTPDTDTLAKITALNGKTAAQGGRALCIGFIGQKLAPLPYTNATNIRYRGYMAMMKVNSDATPKFIASDHATYCDADGDFTFQAPGGLMAGSYNWTAYYWND